MSLLDLINEADLMEIDGNSIRYFGLSEDEMLDAEEGDEDAIVLSVEMVDENYDKWEWYISYKELKEAKRQADDSWLIRYTNEDFPLYMKLFKIEVL
jgi:hypothetical protein